MAGIDSVCYVDQRASSRAVPLAQDLPAAQVTSSPLASAAAHLPAVAPASTAASGVETRGLKPISMAEAGEMLSALAPDYVLQLMSQRRDVSTGKCLDGTHFSPSGLLLDDSDNEYVCFSLVLRLMFFVP